MKNNTIALHVTPKASKNEIVGWVADADGQLALKVKVTAAPEDGKANKALIKFLAKQWDISPSLLEVTAGHASRHKRICIQSETVFNTLMAAKKSGF